VGIRINLPEKPTSSLSGKQEDFMNMQKIGAIYQSKMNQTRLNREARGEAKIL
jgi:hypothetical protein